MAPEGVAVSLISEPAGADRTLQFVTRAGTTIKFREDGSDRVEAVHGGRFTQPDSFTDYFLGSKPHVLECIKGDSTVALEETGGAAKSLADLAGKPARPSDPERKLGDAFSDRKTTLPAGRAAELEAPRDLSRLVERTAPKPSTESRLEDVFVRGKNKSPPSEPLRKPETPYGEPRPSEGTAPDPGAGPSLTDVFASGAPFPPLGSPRLAVDSPAPAAKYPPIASLREGTSRPALVCGMATLAPLTVSAGVALASPQTVGIRNDRTEARGFDYLGASARSLDGNLDIADNARKLVPYEAVAESRRNASEPLWVSIAGMDEPRAGLTEVAEVAAARPARNLRVIIVGGAAEIAISGLDLVGAELNKQSGDPIKLDIEWHAVDATGAIKPAGRYTSLSILVKDATGQAKARPDVFDEAQLLMLFDNFENLLKSQTRVVDKVFWIKGAYSIPSGIPKRFEKFIAAVSSGAAVPHTPAGQASKWLIIVTSRMPGFSIAYLKEPVYSLQVGDVIEEGDAPAGGPRRLIGEVGLLATRLRLASTVATPGSDPRPDRAEPAGRLVLDAKVVFAERGYVLSPEAAVALQGHLVRVSSLWDGPVVRLDVLADFAVRTRQPQPTLFDVLQMADEKIYPRLPTPLPDWFQKPIRDLNPREVETAKLIIMKYAAGANELLDATRRSAATGSNCGLFYVADGSFGLNKLQNPGANRSAAPKSPRENPRAR
jgi:hypothetical protein